MNEFNVVGLSVENQAKIPIRFGGAYVSDKFGLKDINVVVPNELTDEFVDWCENNGASCELL